MDAYFPDQVAGEVADLEPMRPPSNLRDLLTQVHARPAKRSGPTIRPLLGRADP